MRVLSRLPERSMFGFSKLVASEVTQPLWPSSVPRMTNCSAMLGRCCVRGKRGQRWLGFQVLVKYVWCSPDADSKISWFVHEEIPQGSLWAEV